MQEDILDETAEGPEALYERMNLIVDRGQEPMRIDKFLVARIEGASRNKVQQSIENGLVLIDGKTIQPNYKIKPGQEIIVYSTKEARGEEIIPEQMPLNIVYEDDDILIINKPVGLVVHPASGNPSGTLINGIAWYLMQQNNQVSEATLPRFGMVHRIDKNTSGLMVLAFIIFHLLNLTTNDIAPGGASPSPYERVLNTFGEWYMVLAYTVALLAVGFHLRHGVWAAGMTLGANTSAKARRNLNLLAYAVSGVITIGFLIPPFAIFLGWVG